MSRSDEPIMALRIQLHHLPSPLCGKPELKPRLQCDDYPDGCLWAVWCGVCRAQYHLIVVRCPSR